MMEDKLKQERNAYIRWSVIALFLVVLSVVLREPYSKETAKDIVGEISNCFFIPGALLSGFGALSYLSAKGAYDSFRYIFSNFALHSLIYRDQPKKYESLYEYKQKKDEKGRVWFKHMLVAGLGLLVISVIMLIVYAIL